jgi:cytoskeletal protein CcmA (bactofilin family)
MRELRQTIHGDVVIDYECNLWSAVNGDMRVVEGGKVHVRGNVGGDLIVDSGGRAHVLGTVGGNLMMFRASKVVVSGVVVGNATNKDGRLFIGKNARVLGRRKTMGKYAETRVEDDYGIRIERGLKR